MRMRRRPFIKRRHIFKRKRRHFRSRRRLDVHHFKTTFQGGLITQTTTPLGFDVLVAPSALPEIAAISGVFNQIRLNKVVVKFVPSGNINAVAPTAPGIGSSIGQIHTSINHITTSSPSSVNQIISYPTYRVFPLWRTFTRAFIPAFRLDANGLTDVAPKFKQWVRTDSNLGILWTGLQGIIDPNTTVGAATFATYQPYITVYYSCKEKN